MDKHFGDLAKKHLEALFIKINAEKTPFLAERLRIQVIPTIICIVKGKVADTIVGFDDLGGRDDFKTVTLAKSFSAERSRDPDEERREERKLKHLHKKELKGAKRELRRDNQFLAEVQHKEKKEKDQGKSNNQSTNNNKKKKKKKNGKENDLTINVQIQKCK